ncbi:MAG: hypothetical protein EAX86_07860 [Candidatus Heimdallarchaeota archaeon]|nr:hypothetical protein [Candidatus Heimdallarchaeota archaeon]
MVETRLKEFLTKDCYCIDRLRPPVAMMHVSSGIADKLSAGIFLEILVKLSCQLEKLNDNTYTSIFE